MKKKAVIKKILVSRTDKIGDIILTLPLITNTKKSYPDAQITFLASRRIGNLLEGYPGINELVYIEDFKSAVKLFDFIREKGFDMSFSVYPRFKLALIFYLASIRYRVGTAYRWYSFLYNKKIKEHRKTSEKHESDYNLSLLYAVTGLKDYEKKFFFSYTEKEKNSIEDKILFAGLKFADNYIIVHPGSRGSAVDLPLNTLNEFLNIFLDKHTDYKVVLTGSIEDRSVIDMIIPEEYKFSSRVINATGLFNLRGLMVLIDNSKLFISNSTGPIHIAGALGKNIVGFYPNTAPMSGTRWKPLSSNSIVLSPPNGDDMSQISADSILDAADNFVEP